MDMLDRCQGKSKADGKDVTLVYVPKFASEYKWCSLRAVCTEVIILSVPNFVDCRRSNLKLKLCQISNKENNWAVQ